MIDHSMALISLSFIVATLFFLWIAEVPFYSDPYGTKSMRLATDYKKAPLIRRTFYRVFRAPRSTKEFRNWAVNDAERLSMKTIKIVAGEFGNGLRETAKAALDKGFKVTVISGPVSDKTKQCANDINEFLKNKNFIYLELADRPIYHFSIIGPHLFIENPHGLDPNEYKESFGIESAYSPYYSLFDERFQCCEEKAIPLKTNN